ncbi:PP2C family serine/threonine-protein phosphatase [Niallia sp. MER TA 168]|uniref:PP2C family serine/threonine-protein phosphatase n=1 Tax=Niallia sp. MER TA 168 TaxID=2939568 RepID=UPI002040A48D|nr:PP2C family serine/threonine-protein phosphatase [Niallia sp. MER TA 168]
MDHTMVQMKVIYAGASVRGPQHVRNNLPNQDAIRIQSFSFGTVMVVADGVGSRKLSDIGSKMVTKAVVEGVKIWKKQQGASSTHLLRLIHALFELYVHPYERDECATTCLFAVLLTDGRLILAQVGDGAILLRYQDELMMLAEKEDDFVNITTPITRVRTLSDWSVKEIAIGADEFTLFLGTDGVSEDLVPEKCSDYIDYLCSEISRATKQKKRNRIIRTKLLNWPNKYNGDDKSLIIFQRKAMLNVDN